MTPLLPGPKQLVRWLTLGTPMPTQPARRLAPGIPPPTQPARRLAPGIPPPTQPARQLAPGTPPPTQLGRRLAPGTPPPTQPARRRATGTPLPVQLARWLALGALLPTLLGGCVTATVQEVREADTGMAAGDSIVVLGRRSQPASAETELDFISCVAGNMGRGGNRVNVIPEQRFIDATFPWFEPRTAPAQANDLPALLDRPPLAQRLAEMGLKYLVWIEGATERTDSGGSLSCAVTPGGGGCFGFLSWENDSTYEASVWDVESGTAAGRISSEAIGTSYMPAVIVPIPILARVRASACTALADQLKAFVNNESPG